VSMLISTLLIAAQAIAAPPAPQEMSAGKFECSLTAADNSKVSVSGQLGKKKNHLGEFYPAVLVKSVGDPEISGVYSAEWVDGSLQMVDAPFNKKYLVSLIIHDPDLFDGEAGAAMRYNPDKMYGSKVRYGGTCRTHFDYGAGEEFK
jgi:hypothetical protein